MTDYNLICKHWFCKCKHLNDSLSCKHEVVHANGTIYMLRSKHKCSFRIRSCGFHKGFHEVALACVTHIHTNIS